ncbi:outer dynein arm-docking complex subunit 3-like [Neoarius graeffei]|uniref:outer dynein arm-docking complex subunit 3-like n=1 Tax=Neoarius graeffei TaxID=443677 RepID=UPI00298D2BD1|nr:outer dynein arm-docking complex subunit 3-like [Neoarius graeffei]
MSATFRSKNIRPPIQDQISELQRKIQLLERDRSAQCESSQSLIRKNREKILQLRQENKLLHRKLAEALVTDEQVISNAFQSHIKEKGAFRNMSAKAAVQALEQKVCEKMNMLNSLKYMRNTQRHRLEELNTEYNNVRATKRSLLPGKVTHTHTRSNGTNLCVLENRLQEAQLKCQEGEHIMNTYRKVKEYLQEESLTFQSQLDELKREIVKRKQKLRELQLMNNNAHQAKVAAKAELKSQALMVYSERRERELLLNRYKKHAEAQKAQTDRGERQAQRVLHTYELSSQAQRNRKREGENSKTISRFEEAFSRITAATGITDTQELLERFISQRDSHTHLEQMKVQNEHELQQLKQKRDALHTHYQDMKYSGDTKLTQRRMLEECVSQLQREQQRRDAAKDTLDRITLTLNTVSNAVEHLYEKLQHITLKDAPVQRKGVSPQPALELLLETELKLMQLHKGLQGRDIHTLTKEMGEQEFHSVIEGKLPDSNTRVTLPDYQKADLSEEEEDSGDDDDDDVITREFLKRQSQHIINSKTKMKSKL